MTKERESSDRASKPTEDVLGSVSRNKGDAFGAVKRCPGERCSNMSSKLYVGNLSFDTGEQELQELFSSHGEVISANVITDRETGRPRGFGFVEMSQAEDAQKAIQSLDGQEFMGRNLKVNLAKPRENRGGGGGGGGRGGGRGRDGW